MKLALALALLAAACSGERPAGAVEVDARAPLAVIARAYGYRGTMPPVFEVPPDARCATPTFEGGFWDAEMGGCALGLTVTGFGIDDAVYVVRGSTATAWSTTTLVHEAGSHYMANQSHGAESYAATSPEQLKIEAVNIILALATTADTMPGSTP